MSLLQSGQVLFTTNGGATVTAKTRVPLPGQLRCATGLAFISPTTGFATTSAGAIERDDRRRQLLDPGLKRPRES